MIFYTILLFYPLSITTFYHSAQTHMHTTRLSKGLKIQSSSYNTNKLDFHIKSTCVNINSTLYNTSQI